MQKTGLAPDFTVAVAAINRLAVAGFERNLRGLAAFRTRGRKHLAAAGIGIPVTATGAVAALGFSGVTAAWAALGLIGVTLGLEKFLVLSAESERGSAVGTLK